jgi:hypothetical protein
VCVFVGIVVYEYEVKVYILLSRLNDLHGMNDMFIWSFGKGVCILNPSNFFHAQHIHDAS